MFRLLGGRSKPLVTQASAHELKPLDGPSSGCAATAVVLRQSVCITNCWGISCVPSCRHSQAVGSRPHSTHHLEYRNQSGQAVVLRPGERDGSKRTDRHCELFSFGVSTLLGYRGYPHACGRERMLSGAAMLPLGPSCECSCVEEPSPASGSESYLVLGWYVYPCSNTQMGMSRQPQTTAS